MVNNWLDIIQNYLLPPTCILCGNPGQASRDICGPCAELLITNPYCCYRCGIPFEHAPTGPVLCGDCQKRMPGFDETHAPFKHQSAIRFLISGLKFRRQFKNARLLGLLMADYLKISAEMPDCLVPVPLHPRRYRERGFNQSIEIARTLSRELAIPIDLDCCIRSRNTPHQIDLPAKERRKNMKNAFTVNRPLRFDHIAIIDDVMTTGTTVSELARALKKAGAVRVDVWVCARA